MHSRRDAQLLAALHAVASVVSQTSRSDQRPLNPDRRRAASAEGAGIPSFAAPMLEPVGFSIEGAPADLPGAQALIPPRRPVRRPWGGGERGGGHSLATDRDRPQRPRDRPGDAIDTSRPRGASHLGPYRGDVVTSPGVV